MYRNCSYHFLPSSFLFSLLPSLPSFLSSFLPYFFLSFFRVCLVPPGLFLPKLQRKNSHLAVNSSNGRIYFHSCCFSYIRNHCLSVPFVQCLDNHVFLILSVCFISFVMLMFWWEGKTGSCYSIWLCEEAP